jgi:long-chain acyl-CoA synthetase
LQNIAIRPWSHLHQQIGPLNIPKMSVYQLLQKSAELNPNRAAIIFENEVITYRELKENVDRLAGKWQEMNFTKGERIGLMVANHPSYIFCYYAAQALGLIVVQINPMYTLRELLLIIIDSEMRYIVYDETADKTVTEAMQIYKFKAIMSTHKTDNQEIKFIQELIESGKSISGKVPVDAYEDVAVIQYTGGTTGKMKGAMLTHYNLTANVIQSYIMYGEKMIPGKEVILAATPLYHVYAMTSAMNLGIYIGATILLFKKFDTQKILEAINLFRPTFFPGVPKMYNSFVNYPDIEQYDLTCLKICSSGSAPLPLEVITRFESLTGAKIGEGFGMSEASPTTHRNPSNGKRKVGSIGIPIPGTDSVIVDENNQVVKGHCVGELLIKGPQIMKGYWNNPEETNVALRDGWLFTGDLAYMDKDGYFYIVGRKKEMIIVGGFNIYPQEVEGVLYEHPDIKEAAVVGIPDGQAGEVVKAYIVPKENLEIDLEEIKGHCYSKLTAYKVPKQFEIRNELPRNTVGKLLKRILVKEEIEKQGIKA